jgi:septal ring factor EnvC (AmiA/AmiB activator)
VARKPAPGPEPPLVEVVPARVGWGRLIFVGLLSAILGAFLALLFLFMVNGTLDFQRAAVQAAQNEVLRLEGELDALGGKLAQMEAQVAAVQELDRRLAAAEASLGQVATELQATQAEMETMVATMDVLRQEFTNLREDLDGLAGHVSALEGRLGGVEEQLASLSQEVEALGETVLRFDAFLTGLRELLDQAAGALPPTPAAQAMPTLRPSVTVIPLVTPTAPAP